MCVAGCFALAARNRGLLQHAHTWLLLLDNLNDARSEESIITGTTSQIEWAEQIRPQVDAEFRRVASAFRLAATNQDETARADTMAVIAILEEKRLEVMANDHAGYFIRDWRELTDQVRRMIAADGRYKAIRANRDIRLHRSPEQAGF